VTGCETVTHAHAHSLQGRAWCADHERGVDRSTRARGEQRHPPGADGTEKQAAGLFFCSSRPPRFFCFSFSPLTPFLFRPARTALAPLHTTRRTSNAPLTPYRLFNPGVNWRGQFTFIPLIGALPINTARLCSLFSFLFTLKTRWRPPPPRTTPISGPPPSTGRPCPHLQAMVRGCGMGWDGCERESAPKGHPFFFFSFFRRRGARATRPTIQNSFHPFTLPPWAGRTRPPTPPANVAPRGVKQHSLHMHHHARPP